MKYTALLKEIQPLNQAAMQLAQRYQNSLVKPPGSLGSLEEISIRLAGITGRVKNNLPRKLHVLFGADNGIYAEGIASAPQNFTNLLMTYYGNTENCAINLLCKQAKADLRLLDMGIIGPVASSKVLNCKLMQGTANFAVMPAMPLTIAERAVEIGFEQAQYAFDQGYQLIGSGEVGIGNTSSSAACMMAALDLTAEEAVGRGAGLSDAAFANKKRILTAAVQLHQPDRENYLDILAKVGGLDLAALTGLFLGAAYYRLPVIVDGFISLTAAVLAAKAAPPVREYLFPSHASAEPGFRKGAAYLGLQPMLQLNMRLGEGSGCPLAMQLIDDALLIINEMLTFDNSLLNEEDYKKSLGSEIQKD